MTPDDLEREGWGLWCYDRHPDEDEEYPEVMKFSDDVQTVVEPCRFDPDQWYWAVKINGEVYADGEAECKATANLRCILNLDEWKTKMF